jgi:hypothetical protein
MTGPGHANAHAGRKAANALPGRDHMSDDLQGISGVLATFSRHRPPDSFDEISFALPRGFD